GAAERVQWPPPHLDRRRRARRRVCPDLRGGPRRLFGDAARVCGRLPEFPRRGAGTPPAPRVRLERGARGRPAGEPARDPRSLLSPPADGTETLVGPAGLRRVPAPRERMGSA